MGGWLLTQNPFRAREKEDDEKRLYENVSREFTPLPYHLRYKTLYVFSVIGVWFILALSGITEFSAVYAFMYGLISQLPFGTQLTLLITGFLIVGFELLHRFAGNTYFKEFWLDGGKHQSDNNGALAGLILCAAVSLGTSIPGGFDLVESIKKKTQEHLTEKYLANKPQSAAPPTSTPLPLASPSPTPSSAPDVAQALLAINHRLENLEKPSSFHSITPAVPYPAAVPPEQGPRNRPQIGFKLPTSRSSPPEAETPLQAVAMPCNEVIRQIEQEGESLDPADTSLDDIYTVEHRRFTDGKVIRHGKERIRWYVSKYTDQVNRAQLKLQEDPLQEGLQDSLTNFQEKLAYWKSLEEQLKAKLKTVGIDA